MGQLITHIGPAGPRALRAREDAMVKDAISGATWTLPHPISQNKIDLHAYLTTLYLPLSSDVEDSYDWVAGDSSIRDFRSSTTWEVLRLRQDIKLWADVVWFKSAIPKQSFTMWVANYDRLPTRARLATWGLPISPLFPFYSNFDETRDHLLLSCEYSREIWQGIFSRCQPPSTMFTDRAKLLSWMRAASSARLTLLRKLAVQTAIYHLWKQRNNLIHNQISIPSASVFRAIDRELRNIISARRHKKNFDLVFYFFFCQDGST